MAAARFAAVANTALELGRGVYDARRAAALAGVPVSTLHYWAREGIYAPSVSPEPRPRLWSYADLLALRAIYWFRHRNESGERSQVSMAKIRQALVVLQEEGLVPQMLHQLVAVSENGELFITREENVSMRAISPRQLGWTDILHLTRPYLRGPDLVEPRPLLRIIPGKLHGEPHVVNTRIPSASLYALHRAGYAMDDIQWMYPDAPAEAVSQAIDLEGSLQRLAA